MMILLADDDVSLSAVGQKRTANTASVCPPVRVSNNTALSPAVGPAVGPAPVTAAAAAARGPSNRQTFLSFEAAASFAPSELKQISVNEFEVPTALAWP